MFFWNLLTSASNSLSNSTGDTKNLSFWDKYGMMILVGAFLVLLILGMVWSSRKRRKQMEEQMEKISSLGAGTKIETIGGVFGTIVEMNKKEGTFILETGSENSGKSYLKLLKEAIYQTDAVAKKEEEKKEEKAEQAPATEAPAEEAASEEKAE